MWQEITDFATETVIYKEVERTEKGYTYKEPIELANVRVQEVKRLKYQTGNTVSTGGYEVYYITNHSTGLVNDFVNNSKIIFDGNEYTIDSVKKNRFMSDEVEYIKVVLR